MAILFNNRSNRGRSASTANVVENGVFREGSDRGYSISTDAERASAAVVFSDIADIHFFGDDLSGDDVKAFIEKIEGKTAAAREKVLRRQILKDTFDALGFTDSDAMAAEVIDQNKSIAAVKKAHENVSCGIQVGSQFFSNAREFKDAFEGRNELGQNTMLSTAEVVFKRGDTVEESVDIAPILKLSNTTDSTSVFSAPTGANNGNSVTNVQSLYASLPDGCLDVEIDADGNFIFRVLMQTSAPTKKQKPVTRATAKKRIENDESILEESDFEYVFVLWSMNKKGEWICKADQSRLADAKPFSR